MNHEIICRDPLLRFNSFGSLKQPTVFKSSLQLPHSGHFAVAFFFFLVESRNGKSNLT